MNPLIIKLGGVLLDSEEALERLFTALVNYRESHQRPLVIVHGGGCVVDELMKGLNLPVKKKMELTSNEAVKQAVIAGLGYSIMPLIGIKNELESRQLQIIPVKGFPIKSTWSLIWLKEKKLLPVPAAYLSYIRKEKQNIIHDKFDWFEKY